jgi:hypothetical protein
MNIQPGRNYSNYGFHTNPITGQLTTIRNNRPSQIEPQPQKPQPRYTPPPPPTNTPPPPPPVTLDFNNNIITVSSVDESGNEYTTSEHPTSFNLNFSYNSNEFNAETLFHAINEYKSINNDVNNILRSSHQSLIQWNSINPPPWFIINNNIYSVVSNQGIDTYNTQVKEYGNKEIVQDMNDFDILLNNYLTETFNELIKSFPPNANFKNDITNITNETSTIINSDIPSLFTDYSNVIDNSENLIGQLVTKHWQNVCMPLIVKLLGYKNFTQNSQLRIQNILINAWKIGDSYGGWNDVIPLTGTGIILSQTESFLSNYKSIFIITEVISFGIFLNASFAVKLSFLLTKYNPPCSSGDSYTGATINQQLGQQYNNVYNTCANAMQIISESGVLNGNQLGLISHNDVYNPWENVYNTWMTISGETIGTTARPNSNYTAIDASLTAVNVLCDAAISQYIEFQKKEMASAYAPQPHQRPPDDETLALIQGKISVFYETQLEYLTNLENRLQKMYNYLQGLNIPTILDGSGGGGTIGSSTVLNLNAENVFYTAEEKTPKGVVSIAGNPGKQTVSMYLSKGMNGKMGAQGQQGLTGPQGKSGNAGKRGTIGVGETPYQYFKTF